MVNHIFYPSASPGHGLSDDFTQTSSDPSYIN